jgi:putative CocE/NonD family hydrolase
MKPADPEPKSRGRAARLLDAGVGRALRLPPARTDFDVRSGVRIPTRDGLFLMADHYRPLATPIGTILIRGPYGRHLPLALQLARVYAARGYHAVFVSSRGTFGSEGHFRPMELEAEDGLDVVAWMVAEPWFTGSFATIGPSYLGHTQWAILTDPPPEMATAVVLVGPHDFARHVWGTGAFKLDFLGWSDGIVHQEDPGPTRRLVRMATAGRRMRAAQDRLPLVAAADDLLEGRAPWYPLWVSRPDLDDPFWRPMRHEAALDRVGVPVLLIGGWQDLFLEQTVLQYQHLRRRGLDVALTIGPWNHYQASASPLVTRQTFDWLEHHLAGHPGHQERQPVRVFVTGADEWRSLGAWPPAASDTTWYLQRAEAEPGPGGLTPALPGAQPPSRFTYDPAQPTPTMGGPLLARQCRVDDGQLAARSDVLAFDTGPLRRDLDVAGAPRVELAHFSDNPHFDLFVRVSEVDPQGRSHNLTEGYRRFGGRDPAEIVTVEMAPVFHRFRAGWGIRLLVAGGSFPRFSRNLGTNEPPGTATGMEVSRQTIGHGPDRPSRLVLPVVD